MTQSGPGTASGPGTGGGPGTAAAPDPGTASPGTPSPGATSPGATSPGTAGSLAQPRQRRPWHRALSRRARFWLAAGVPAAVAVAVGLTLAGQAGGTGSVPPQLTARNFSIPVLGQPGRHLALGAYAGKPVIVNFFASWCPPCQRETPLLARYYRGEHGKVTIIGVDINDPASAAVAFVHKTGVSYPVGVDSPPMPTAAAYNVSGLPQTFFLNAQHRIVKRVIGAVTRRELTAGTAMIDTKAK